MIKYLLIASTQVDPVCWVFLESDSDGGTGRGQGHDTLFILVKQRQLLWPSLSVGRKQKGIKELQGNVDRPWIYTHGKIQMVFMDASLTCFLRFPPLLPASPVPCQLPWKCQALLSCHHTARWTSCTLVSDFPHHFQVWMSTPPNMIPTWQQATKGAR